MKERKIRMNKSYIGKRLLSTLMIIAMVVTSMLLPQNVYEVYADTIGAPSAATYMDNSSGNPYKKYSKVYFGKVDASTPRKWYVCGTEDGALVLLCDPDNNFGKVYLSGSTTAKNYFVTTNSLYTNIYNLHNNSNYFSNAEENLMKEVSISCPEDCNDPGSGIISNNVKMYPANVSTSDPMTLVVGKGLGDIDIKISDDCFKIGSNPLYAREVRIVSDKYCFACATFGSVFWTNKRQNMGINPAFHLNLSSVLFSSAAQEACSDASFDTNNVMTCRYDSAKDAAGAAVADRITSSATAKSSGITVTNPTSGEFLYVQWKEGETDKIKSFELSSSKTSYTTSDGIPTLTADCKIWIEKKNTDDNLVYAKNVEFYGHTHSWTYGVKTTTTTDDTLTAYCSETGCPSGAVDTEHAISLTLLSNNETYSGSSITKDSLFSGMDFSTFNTATGKSLSVSDIKLYAASDTSKTSALSEVNAAGSYTAYLTVEGKTASCNVTVSPNGYTVSFDSNGGSGSMSDVTEVSGSYTLPACEFSAPSGKTFDGWATSADGSKIAGSTYNVTENITFYALWKGPSTVSVTGVSLNKSTITMGVGETYTLKATIEPNNATDKSVTWSSDKESVAKVDSNGKITAVSEGTAVITVKTRDGEKTASCTVTVKTSSQDKKQDKDKEEDKEEDEKIDHDTYKSESPAKTLMVSTDNTLHSLMDMKIHSVDEKTRINQTALVNAHVAALKVKKSDIIVTIGVYPRRTLSDIEKGSKQKVVYKLPKTIEAGKAIYALCYSKEDGAYMIMGIVDENGYATFNDYLLRDAVNITVFTIE